MTLTLQVLHSPLWHQPSKDELPLLQGSFTETRDKQCACCIRGEHKPVIYTCFIEVILGF